MSTLDLDGLAPNTEVLVAPVHLAGPGTRAAVFGVLDNAEDPLGVPDWINVRLAKPTATAPRAQAALVRRPYAAHPPAPGAKASTPSASSASHGRSRRQR
ncbi:hypothetical protein [Streptomyces sp. NPDC014685]|uniref:hypothetical protein n=1 Tax=Streptomyces sp. NPDC014685 TaxID=3364881 RepID=UPI00370082B1